MLWFDDTPQRALDKKIELAIQYYQDKYGNSPNICYVHPSVLSKDVELPVRACKSLQPSSFYPITSGLGWLSLNLATKSLWLLISQFLQQPLTEASCETRVGHDRRECLGDERVLLAPSAQDRKQHQIVHRFLKAGMRYLVILALQGRA